ncbi:MAG TPA: type III polyketide synthase [Candidatus Paceibacterota bacterium]|nr:type III polyketide synthase [Verrucomicrobiota bacterium]HRY46512.1 type III polyketide synthase [Candidatus Paceibacterota bacterium]HRZ99863.1 type III polyketide synthase [Candidatus Paceibacterota bacterium]
MKTYIHQIETLLPSYTAPQNVIARQLGAWSGDPATARLIRHVFLKSGIETRHSVIPDFTMPDQAELFSEDSQGHVNEPSTQERNRCFARHAGPMSVELARRLVDGRSGFAPGDITHVITVSCTGFVNPGPDYRIVTELGLPATVERYNLGFMGCYAALPALRMAQQFCQARPDAVVLVVCIELCSLHMQMKSTPDSILANALFSDGASAALVSARPPRPGHAALALNHFCSAIAAEGVCDMAWEIGEKGFNLVLSSYVPDVIAANVGRIVGDLLSNHELEISSVPLWAVHPGGRAILDKVEESLGLEPWQLEASRDVLRECGNMSSVTILFVLKRMLAKHGRESATLAAMAFGPGLTIETGLFEMVPASRNHVGKLADEELIEVCP